MGSAANTPKSHLAPRGSSRLLRAALVVALLVPLGMFARAGASPVAPAATSGAALRSAASPEDVDHRRTDLDLELLSRTYNAGDDNFTIVTEATLSSNKICLPLVFNCIVSQVDAPSNATLTSVTCDTAGWNHLLVFRENCMKQLFFAGHDQKFTFTWTTNPGVSSGSVDLAVEFGRGILPDILDHVKTARLAVNLDSGLELDKECPTEVEAGGSLTCTITLDYPAVPGGAGPLVGIPVTDAPDADLADLITGGTLAFASGDGTWTCAGLVCNDGTLENGQSATFEFTATVKNDPDGGTGVNGVSVSTPGGEITADDTVVVVGTGDTRLEIEKTTSDTEANPGEPITWTVKVTNVGPNAATDVTLNDITPAGVDGLTLVFADGAGDWSCEATSCSTASLPVGSATFTAAGTVSPETKGDTSLVNEVGVVWANNVLGPDFPITAGSAVPVVESATTTTSVPASEPTTTSAPISGGTPLSVAG